MGYGWRDEILKWKVLTDALPDFGAADIDQAHAHDLHIGRQSLTVDGKALTRIDNDIMMSQDFVVLIPLAEFRPVVTAKQQSELPVGVFLREGLKGIPCIGRFGQLKFEIAGNESRYVLQGCPGKP